MFNSIYIIKEKAADHQQMLIMVDLRLGSVCSLCGKKRKWMKAEAVALTFWTKLHHGFFLKIIIFWSKSRFTFYIPARATFVGLVLLLNGWPDLETDTSSCRFNSLSIYSLKDSEPFFPTFSREYRSHWCGQAWKLSLVLLCTMRNKLSPPTKR